VQRLCLCIGVVFVFDLRREIFQNDTEKYKSVHRVLRQLRAILTGQHKINIVNHTAAIIGVPTSNTRRVPTENTTGPYKYFR